MNRIQLKTLQTYYYFILYFLTFLLRENYLKYLCPVYYINFILFILHNNILDYFIFWIIPEFNNYSITIKILILIFYIHILFITYQLIISNIYS
jgi:hypothetical protein